MPQPTFVIAGAGKSGTTSLYGYLAGHPDVAMSEPKEPHTLSIFSDIDDIHDDYDKIFREAGAATARGEASPNYLVIPEVPERMRRALPGVKIIFLFRNPVERAWSHYRWLVGLGIERGDFHDAFATDLEYSPPFESRPAGDRRHYWPRSRYFTHGRYGYHLARYLDYFDRDEICVLTTESLAVDPSAVASAAMRHVGVDAVAVDTRSRRNVTTSIPRFPRLTNVLRGREVVDPARTDPLGRLVTRTSETIANTRGVHGACRRTATLLDDLTRPVPVLGDDERRWVADRFADDVAQLRELTGHDFVEWDDDFPRT